MERRQHLLQRIQPGLAHRLVHFHLLKPPVHLLFPLPGLRQSLPQPPVLRLYRHHRPHQQRRRECGRRIRVRGDRPRVHVHHLALLCAQCVEDLLQTFDVIAHLPHEPFRPRVRTVHLAAQRDLHSGRRVHPGQILPAPGGAIRQTAGTRGERDRVGCGRRHASAEATSSRCCLRSGKRTFRAPVHQSST